MFSDLMFEGRRHLYFIKGSNYPSVSSKVEGYCEKFDEGYWLPICAKKEQVTEHELKHKWQTLRVTAAELGTRVHKFMEKYNGTQSPSLPQEIAGIKFLKSLQGKYSIVAKELRMYSKKYKYAGTVDLILYNLVTKKLVIADYKTNGDLFKSFRYMISPFNYLENMPYNHYQIQLSLYQGMLKEKGFDIEERLLVHLKADGEFKVYPLYDYTLELSKDLKLKIAA